MNNLSTFFKYVLLGNLFFMVWGGNHINECTKIPKTALESHLATKTPYRVIANRNDSQLNYPGCVPIRIWSIVRHGTRNPSKKVIKKAKNDLSILRKRILSSQKTKLCEKELSLFRNWNFNLGESEEKYLVYEGEMELIELAARMQNRFPEVLYDYYDPDHYKFKYTATQRTLRSAESFATGLFGRYNTDSITYPEPMHRDPILRFYKLCDKWKLDVDKNPKSLIETKKFMESDLMKKAIKYMVNKTGVKGITSDDIQLIYTVCAFELAWYKRRFSPWCTLFDDETIQILEFARDLEYYWIDGYGYELTHKQACSAFSDMFSHISPNSSYPNATFYFTHSGTILKFLSHLGLHKDNFVLTHKDFLKERKWKTSEIDAFASNIAFVTYSCEDESYKILVLHQEKVVHLPGCPKDSDLCDLKQIKHSFRNSLEKCDFDEICKISSS
ncbi:multiple inositol polyphosphate phosphatase 1 [Condylostylus longicornis]|uniref:multiple inositol polyphosphate phosphatase 1 n=1 Tax=Condylostylus longicornis TaxID=2530218 RepID=UPI00244DE735|nr:multiple inositol polyphosphate phosphatase 1 [Condylostylus longicornis]